MGFEFQYVEDLYLGTLQSIGVCFLLLNKTTWDSSLNLGFTEEGGGAQNPFEFTSWFKFCSFTSDLFKCLEAIIHLKLLTLFFVYTIHYMGRAYMGAWHATYSW